MLATAIATGARLGTFVATRAVASSWLGPYGVTAVTVVSVVVFFTMSENSASAAPNSPTARYQRELNKLFQIYQNSSSPQVMLEALRKMFVVIYGMQLCLDAAIQEQIYAGGKAYSTDYHKKRKMLMSYTQAVVTYKKTANHTSALLGQIIFAAESLLQGVQTGYGWNQAMMNNVHAPYSKYFAHFKVSKNQWESRTRKVQTDSLSVQNYLFRSKIF